jgi:hypothetical protein
MLFVVFGAYRLAVAVRTKSLMCSCAGYAKHNPATPQALAGVMFTSILQAAIASMVTLPATGYNARNAALARFIVWGLPFVILIIGTCVAQTVRLISRTGAGQHLERRKVTSGVSHVNGRLRSVLSGGYDTRGSRSFDT